VRKALLRRPLAPARPDQLGHLRLHQLLADPAQRLTQEIEPLALEQVADNLLSRHPLRLGHRGDSSRRRLGGLDESERRGGRTLTRLRPTRTYTTLWDVTPASRLAELLAREMPVRHRGRARVATTRLLAGPAGLAGFPFGVYSGDNAQRRLQPMCNPAVQANA
jgi:hypothetical protein